MTESPLVVQVDTGDDGASLRDTQPVAERLSAARKQAWETRRANYGPQGHRGYALRQSNHGALRLVIQLHAEGVLSEGQVAQSTGLDRVEIRRRREAVEELAALAALDTQQSAGAAK